MPAFGMELNYITETTKETGSNWILTSAHSAQDELASWNESLHILNSSPVF